MTKQLLILAVALLSIPAHAMHVYAGYDCSSPKLNLRYDGPGSNYAVGGYSHLSLKGSTERILSADSDSDSTDIGSVIAGERLQVEFSVEAVKAVGQSKVDTKVGDKCEANEVDYVHTDSWSIRTVRIMHISGAAAKHLGLHKGNALKFACAETEDVPVRCPSTGRYGKNDL